MNGYIGTRMSTAKNQSRMMSADMSPQAIEAQLRTVVELNELCDQLGRAKISAPTGRDNKAQGKITK